MVDVFFFESSYSSSDTEEVKMYLQLPAWDLIFQ